MPPRLPDEEKIPLARFNDSLEGREKEVYRQGLALRYGKKKQMISGMHYNFSFGNELLNYLYQQLGRENTTIHGKQDFINDLYLALTRNYLRYHWLLIYLFGASPANDPTYDSVICQELKTVAKCCPPCRQTIRNYQQYATSLRVSRFGYSNTRQQKKNLHFNCLSEYTQTLQQLLATKSNQYTKFGIYRNGSQIQLNDNELQKESEFYLPIRLKQNIEKGETQLQALAERGIRYLEVRILDLNPFEKTGISLGQLYFLQVFMLYCLFEQSGFVTDLELAKINQNHHLVALNGRKPGLRLQHYLRGPISLKEWSAEIFIKLKTIADYLDKNISGNKYRQSVLGEFAKIVDRSILPASRIIMEMKEYHESYLDFGLRRAKINLAENIINSQEENYG
jgi:glutamate--cysteine ligase